MKTFKSSYFIVGLSFFVVSIVTMWAVSLDKLDDFAKFGDAFGGFFSPMFALAAFFFSLRANKEAQKSEKRMREIDIFELHLKTISDSLREFFVESSLSSGAPREHKGERALTELGHCYKNLHIVKRLFINDGVFSNYLSSVNALVDFVDGIEDPLLREEFSGMVYRYYFLIINHLNGINDNDTQAIERVTVGMGSVENTKIIIDGFKEDLSQLVTKISRIGSSLK